MKITRHQELEVYKKAFEVAMLIFELSKSFPNEETYSLTDQIRRSSRSVCSNIAEAWRKRRYEAAFIAKLNDSEGESAETQTWLEFAVKCKYIDRDTGRVSGILCNSKRGRRITQWKNERKYEKRYWTS
jgi:four helix bundle protein